MASTWLAYNDLAWTEDILADPSEYKDEVIGYIDLIRQTATGPQTTLLHLGCGAGGYDHIFKQYFTVTGVDVSLGMLNKARIANPDVEYYEGDMRSIRLNRMFDVVVIPDSIDYMVTLDDLRQAMQTAALHLRSGGVLLVVAKTEELFKNNNFVYTGEKDNIQVTLFENNYINPFRPNTYEATLAYLIRNRGELSIFTDHQVLGLFPHNVWDRIFKDAGFVMKERNIHGTYDNFLLEDGEYTVTVFFGIK